MWGAGWGAGRPVALALARSAGCRRRRRRQGDAPASAHTLVVKQLPWTQLRTARAHTCPARECATKAPAVCLRVRVNARPCIRWGQQYVAKCCANWE